MHGAEVNMTREIGIYRKELQTSLCLPWPIFGNGLPKFVG